MKRKLFSNTTTGRNEFHNIKRKSKMLQNASLFQNPHGGILLLLDFKRSEPKYEFVVLP